MTPSELTHRWETPRRTHVLSPLVAVVPLIKQSIGLVFIALATGRLWLLAVGAVLAVVFGWLNWWRRTWYFDGQFLIREQGLLERQTRRVPVGRIQQVELVQPILHRMFGLATLKVETAGGATESGVHLDALRRSEAEALRLELLAARSVARAVDGVSTTGSSPSEAATPDGIPPPPPVEQRILALDPARLMLAGITSSTLMVVGAVSFAALDALADLPDTWSESVEDGAQGFIESLNWLSGAAVLVAVLALVAALASVALHHGLTVVLVDDELRMWRGLFERKDAVLPLARVQAVTIRQNPVQRLLGMAAVQVRSASGKGTQESLTVPLADFAQISRLIVAATQTSVDLDNLAAAPPASLPRRIVRRLAVGAVATAALVMLLRPNLAIIVALVVVAVLAAVGLGIDAHRNLGFRIDPDHMVIRWGSLLKRTTVVTTTRVQSTTMAASPMQRRVGVCTMVLDLAGIGVRPTLIDQRPAQCLEVESAVRRSSMEDVRVSLPSGPYATLGTGPQLNTNEEL